MDRDDEKGRKIGGREKLEGRNEGTSRQDSLLHTAHPHILFALLHPPPSTPFDHYYTQYNSETELVEMRKWCARGWEGGKL